jgi:hypothetical protein
LTVFVFLPADALLLCRQRIPGSALAALPGVALLDPATDRCLADFHALTELDSHQFLLLGHTNDIPRRADIELPASLCD